MLSSDQMIVIMFGLIQAKTCLKSYFYEWIVLIFVIVPQ